jgi:arsenate reductase-like glutaredoxin family protein
VIQTGLYLNSAGSSYVYVRFRCGRCKRVGEQLVQESNWDPAVLHFAEVQMSEEDLHRFEAMGEITPEEVIGFHYAIARLGADGDDAA